MMQSGRLLSILFQRSQVSANSDQCWALLNAVSSSPGWPAAAATAVVPACTQAMAVLAGQAHAFTTAAAQAAAAARPAAAAGNRSPQSQAKPEQKPGGAAAEGSFDQLRQQYQEQLSIRNSQGEGKLLALIWQAGSGDQVQAALDLVRWDRMNRARLHQVAHISTHVTRALLKAGSRAGLGPEFAVQLLRQAEELGLEVSLVVCEDVLEACIKQQDYWAAAEAWVYTQLYCGDASTQQVPAAQAKGSLRPLQLAWASKSLLRLYARGLGDWLQQQGCVNQQHEEHARHQLQQIVQELKSRGADVARLEQALQPTAPAAAAAVEEEGKGIAEEQQDQTSNGSESDSQKAN